MLRVGYTVSMAHVHQSDAANSPRQTATLPTMSASSLASELVQTRSSLVEQRMDGLELPVVPMPWLHVHFPILSTGSESDYVAFGGQLKTRRSRDSIMPDLRYV